MVEGCANTPCRDLHELLLPNPLPQDLAEVRRHTLTATGDIEVVLFEDCYAVAGFTEDIGNREAADT